MPLFSGKAQDLLKVILGISIYTLFFTGYGNFNKWLYIPLDILIVGGGTPIHLFVALMFACLVY